MRRVNRAGALQRFAKLCDKKGLLSALRGTDRQWPQTPQISSVERMALTARPTDAPFENRPMSEFLQTIDVLIEPRGLEGIVRLPKRPIGLITFAHGSGSSRFSPRNAFVAQRLSDCGFATLLFDLLTADEEQDRRNVFDIPLLGSRLGDAVAWASTSSYVQRLPIGLFGASTGAAAALVAAANEPGRIRAVVSRGGRPDLAEEALFRVQAATLLIVGGLDYEVLDLNRRALALLRCQKRLDVVPRATHLFEEPGTLEAVVEASIGWLAAHVPEMSDDRRMDER